MISRWTRVRIGLVALGLGGLGISVGRRGVELQIEQAEELKEKAEDQYLKEIELPPERGRILDRNGQELATTVQLESIFCNPRRLLAVPDGVKRLAGALAMDGKALTRSLQSRRYFAYVKRQVSREEAARALALGLPGVASRKEPKRIYPGKELGATVIGHANIDGRGVEGVELAFDRYLRGSRSQAQGVRDGEGRELLLEGLLDARETRGKDVVLTLDRYLMFVTERALHAAVDKWKAKAGMVVVMDPRNGEILAAASAPNYDPNDPKAGAGRGARNRAVTDVLEPGSTMKAFTFAAALDAGRVRPTDWFDCQMGLMQVGKYRIRDTHPQGTLTAAEVFQHSSNIGTVKIARRIGKEALHAALVRFGFGRATAVGLPGERQGTLRPVERWGEIGFANVAFGQGLTVTPLQMTAGYAAIAAGGMYHPPRIGLRVVGPDGKEEPLGLLPNAHAEERVISEKAANTLLSIMQLVTQEKGTAKQAALDGFLVAGKTGTAQKVSGGRYDPDKWVASFIGVVPADKPRLAISVIIDEPQPDHLGGKVSAPVFREIAEAALKYLGVPPNEALLASKQKAGEKDAAGAKGKPGSPRAAEAAAPAEGPGSEQPTWAGLEQLESEGEGIVLGEGEGEVIPVEETAVDEDVIAVPSFVGLSMGAAIRAARKAGIEIAPEGSGIAVAQSPAPGPSPRGAICRVSFRPGT